MLETFDARSFCDAVLDRARALGADYADIRVVDRDDESIVLRTGKVEHLDRSSNSGFGVRVLLDGAWGFSSSPKLTAEDGARVAEEAVRIARASSAVKTKNIRLAPVDVCEGKFESPFEINPFDVPLEEKIGLLRDTDAALRKHEKVKLTDCSMEFWRYHQFFASTEGAFIEQTKTESGAGFAATAIEGSEVQRRSYPAAFGGDYASSGYEFVESLNMVDHADVIAREAVELLSAPPCPTGDQTLILEGSMLALQVHESCGHPIELDRVFGMESSYAGTSFLTPDKLGNFKYGSDIVNITADATLTHGLGGFAFDDEGVPAQCVDIIKDGIFSGYLTSRETAVELGQRSMGAMRADGWNRIPLIRMTNINLMPGADGSLDELIADTPDGMYASGIRSWSIDDKRLNFHFATEAAQEIKDGSLGKLYKNPMYSGITPEFWGSCDAICGEDEWHIWGVPNCGKGEPGQSAHVGHGVSPARFKNVKMEGAK